MPPKSFKEIEKIEPYSLGYSHGQRSYALTTNMYLDDEMQTEYEQGYEDGKADVEYGVDELAVKAEERKRLAQSLSQYEEFKVRYSIAASSKETWDMEKKPIFSAKTGQPIVFSKTIWYE